MRICRRPWEEGARRALPLASLRRLYVASKLKLLFEFWRKARRVFICFASESGQNMDPTDHDEFFRGVEPEYRI